MDKLGFGCAAIGGLHGPVDAAEAQAALEAAWQAGIRAYDVAPLYGAGEGERRLGRFLTDKPRESYRLSTKIGWRVVDGRCVFDTSCDGGRRMIEESRSRLGVERLDAVYIHDIDASNFGTDQPRVFAEAMAQTLPMLLELKKAGLIGAVGVGVNDPEVCLAALRHGGMDTFLIAGCYTLLDQRARPALLPACLAEDVRVMVGAPFNTGILAGGTRFRHAAAAPEILERARFIDGVCKDFGIPLGAAALKFPLLHPAVSHVVPGPRTPKQARECVEWMGVAIPSAFWSTLGEAPIVKDVAA
jgi:D-threo-aldose 1-dehydrogenase